MEDEDGGLMGTLVSAAVVFGILILAYYVYEKFFSLKKGSIGDDPSMFGVRSASGVGGLSGSVSGGVGSAPVRRVRRRLEAGQGVRILYGSQTGTAESFAEDLGAEAGRQGLAYQVENMEDYDRDQLERESAVVFVVSTYGEGEPTDSGRDFSEWLQGETDDTKLANVSFAVFGLGNTTYEHYNAFAKLVDRCLAGLGAKRFYELGLGDEDSTLEDDFTKWRSSLWTPLAGVLGVELKESGSGAGGSVEPRFRLVSAARAKVRAVGSDKGGPYDHKKPYLGRVMVNRELHGPTSDRSCRHVEIAIAPEMGYKPGDHLGIHPQNQDADVLAVAERLFAGMSPAAVQEQLDKVVCLIPRDTDASEEDSAIARRAHLGPVRLRQALKELVDLTTPPRKLVLAALAHYAEDAAEAAALKQLAAPEDEASPGSDSATASALAGGYVYREWIKQSHRSIVDVLTHFRSVRVPLGHFLELMPALSPRFYSISSSPLMHRSRVHVTCVRVEFDTPAGRHHKGVCSCFLGDLGDLPALGSEANQKAPLLPVFVRSSKFRLPTDPTLPVIMVGPGTGLAPFRGFIQHRQKQRESRRTDLGPMWLFFGCRNRDVDYLYREELEAALADGTLSELLVAFSREQSEKVYVQHLLAKRAADVWKLLQDGGYFYICGDAREMATSVKRALLQLFASEGNLSDSDAVAYFDKLVDSGRYQTDVWY